MLDDFRTRPKQTLEGIISRRKERDPQWQVPMSIRTLEWMFLRDSRTRDVFAALALKLMGIQAVRNHNMNAVAEDNEIK